LNSLWIEGLRNVSTIYVIVAAATPDLATVGIEAAVSKRSDMSLVSGGVITAAEVTAALKTVPASVPCVALLVGRDASKSGLADHWLAARADLVVACVNVVEHTVQIETRDPNLEMASFLDALHDLVDRRKHLSTARIAHFQVHAAPDRDGRRACAISASTELPLLMAAMQWIHAVLYSALDGSAGESADLPGLTLTRATLRSVMEGRPAKEAAPLSNEVASADAGLSSALQAANAPSEPLASAAHAFNLTPLELRILLLALSPELDVRYQRCMGVLLDDLSRRVSTLGLCAALIGEPSGVRRHLSQSGNLARWRLLEGRPGVLPSADESLRVEPAVAGWLLGESEALEHDPRIRRLMRHSAWPGARLFESGRERELARDLVSTFRSQASPQWQLFAGDDASGWRALLELGAIRIEAARLAAIEISEIEDAGVRLGRLALVTKRPLVIDACTPNGSAAEDDGLCVLLAAIDSTGVHAGILCLNAARIVRLLGSSACAIHEQAESAAPLRASAIQTAAKALDVELDAAGAEALAQRYPMPHESVEQAMQIARARRLPTDDAQRRHERFHMACRDVAAAGVSHLADRIEPAFDLADVILPADRAQQLSEIVDSVRLASEVLDGWGFREKLPYGNGVTALFHGASGTGKTMAAHGVARSLGIQILRIDLSRVVSKYIGETEKNLDCVFTDAHRSGAAILIDEADALLGKRSEVKDAHDRYANIEVAYLLQRMEAFDGLAILTTNMRQNLDPAFVRRLRFIVEFPRPDADARERIWRRCLPPDSHVVDGGGFRQLARKIELTGGHIRQITVRAAFAAAAQGTRVGLGHIAYASRAEFAKLGMPAVDLHSSEHRLAA
jgi:hypothetical protein